MASGLRDDSSASVLVVVRDLVATHRECSGWGDESKNFGCPSENPGLFKRPGSRPAARSETPRLGACKAVVSSQREEGTPRGWSGHPGLGSVAMLTLHPFPRLA